jgi:hypothetical protein
MDPATDSNMISNHILDKGEHCIFGNVVNAKVRSCISNWEPGKHGGHIQANTDIESIPPWTSVDGHENQTIFLDLFVLGSGECRIETHSHLLAIIGDHNNIVHQHQQRSRVRRAGNSNGFVYIFEETD